MSKRKSKTNNKPITPKIIKRGRLEALKEEKFLTNRIFNRISENMHYEIFKYLKPKDLLAIRATKIGGYQLVTNRLLRSRIKNYFKQLKPRQIEGELSDPKRDQQRLKLLLQQTKILDFQYILEFRKLLNWLPYLKDNSQIIGIKLGYIIYIYIYYVVGRFIGEDGVIELNKYISSIPTLRILHLGMIYIYIYIYIENTGIGNKGAIALSKEIDLYTNLHKIRLSIRNFSYG